MAEDPRDQPGRNQLGRFLRECRQAVSLTARRVAQLSRARPGLTPLSHSNLLAYENGHYRPTFDKLLTLSTLYGVPIAAFEEQLRIDMGLAPGTSAVPPEELQSAADDAAREGDHARAVALYQQALDLDPEALELHLKTSAAAAALGLTSIARDELENLLAKPRLAPELVARAELGLAQLHLDKGSLRLASLFAQHAAEASDVPELERWHVRALLILARAEEEAGHPSAAHYQQALTLLERQGHPAEAIRIACRVALLKLQDGDLDSAREQLEATLETARRHNDPESIGNVLVQLQRVHFRTSNLARARELGIEAKRVLSEVPVPELLFVSTYYMWRSAIADGQLSLARAYDERLASLAHELSETPDEVGEWQRMRA